MTCSQDFQDCSLKEWFVLPFHVSHGPTEFHNGCRLRMGGQPYQPFAVEQKAVQKESAAEKNPFADPGWTNATPAPAHNSTAWQDVHLDHANAGSRS